MWTEWFQLYHTNCSAVTPPPETDSFVVLNDPLEDPDLQSQLVFLISLSRLWRCLWRNLTRLFEAINPNIYLTDTRTFSKLTLQRVRNTYILCNFKMFLSLNFIFEVNDSRILFKFVLHFKKLNYILEFDSWSLAHKY